MAGSISDGIPGRSPVSPRHSRSRAESISSDRPSTIGHTLVSPPLTVSPDAAFIASSAASQIVTNDHDSHADTWYDQSGIEPAGETALVSHAALQLVNNFLDQLLFSFLQLSGATTLAALRPAVTEVLKPKLAKDAINNADEELREYLGGGDEDDFVRPGSGEPSTDWDLELVWKRTRLRCMVYSSLGDLEEEDEDMYMEQENLEIGLDDPNSDVISPAVAIFLTSVLEYMGELTLTVAGQAAYHRMRSKFEKGLKDGSRSVTDIADRIVVEEADMERVALDRTLGRLWRGWKKRIRTPSIMEIGGRPFSRSSLRHSRHDSLSADNLSPRPFATEMTSEAPKSVDEEEGEEHVDKEINPADVPLPMYENDIDQIEVPGLAVHSDDEAENEDDEPRRSRPKSHIYSKDASVAGLFQTIAAPFLVRKRSSSVPIPRSLRFIWPGPEEEEEADEEVSGEARNADERAVPDAEARADEVESENAAEQASSGAFVATTTSAGHHVEDIDDEELEKAEIVTSSRVSVSSASSPISENGHKKSASVRSARLVDVPAPKSPTDSRSSSTERVERVRAPAERSRASLHNASTISESDEEPDYQTSGRLVREPSNDRRTPELSTLPEDVPPRSAERHTTISQSPRKSSLVNSTATNSRAINSSNSHPRSHFVEELDQVPDVPPPRISSHSARHAPRTDSMGRASIERIRTRESEDAPPLPIQVNATPRSTHTSGSTSSNATSRLKAVRTSEEHIPNRAESVARNFEELIHSNQTITYTLTPENMRDLETPRSPVIGRISHSKGEDRGGDRSRSSSDIKGTSASQRINGMSSYPTSASKGSKPSPVAVSMNSSARSPTSRSAAPISPGMKPQPQLARDARVPSESIADFAEFIKSTGPPGDNRPAPIRNVNGGVTATQSSAEPRRVPSLSSRNRYQPREAAADGKTDTSDLADFLRQGPPVSGSTQRGPRHGNRSNTLESEGSTAPTIGRGFDSTIPEVRHSQASTNFTDNSMPSMQSSTNSSSALIRKKNNPPVPSKMFDDDMMPKRKTRRVKDPYAIDLSDEEDLGEDFMAAPKPPPKKEESLAEFLRNYQPPPEPVVAPISHKIPKKKSSAPSLINRFTRSHRESKDAKVSNGIGASESRSLSSRTGTAGTSRSTGGYVPIQVNIPSGYDKYGSLDVNASQARSTPSRPSGKVPMKKFEPREAVSSSTRTSDLAAFLRDSEPPPSFSGPGIDENPQSPDGNSNFSKMFSRRKKPSVV